jgi:Raf kinase inhibitor-like YbhB/YbcL family protein
MMSINLRSDDFIDGGAIPKRYAGDGEDLSPQLSWDSNQAVKSWALIMDDPDAPGGTYTHWVLFNLPGDVTNLPPGASGTRDQLEGATEGKNGRGSIGYYGPNPPSGTHRYVFRIYGLESRLNLEEGASKEDVLAAIGNAGKIAEGQLIGTYSKGQAAGTAG